MPSTHTYGFISNTFVGITLFVSTQGCGRPQIADEQKVDTHVFCCVVINKLVMPDLGVNRSFSQKNNEESY